MHALGKLYILWQHIFAISEAKDLKIRKKHNMHRIVCKEREKYIKSDKFKDPKIKAISALVDRLFL